MANPSIQLKFKMDILPEIRCFTSRPVLFIVDDVRYAGHYHLNGFFYVSDDKKYEKPIFYGKHPKTQPTAFGSQDLGAVPNVTSWEYI